jgi:5-methyltetrahydropteroyltriglutamate--homocysteine methyltransferase
MNKGRPTVYSDEERCAMALSCAWVDAIVPNVPYSIITEKLLDENRCAVVAHGDDMITLPGKPHMYSEAQAANRFCVFPRTPGVSTTAIRARVLAAYDDAGGVRSAPQPLEAVASSEMVRRFELARYGPTRRPAGDSGRAPSKLVYAHGSFDLYNPSDVAFLHAARQLGDSLLVGVVDDAAVRSASGSPHLPIFPLAVRALNVLSHEAVDNVLIGAPAVPSEAFLRDRNVAVVAVDRRDHERRDPNHMVRSGVPGVHSHAMPSSLDAAAALGLTTEVGDGAAALVADDVIGRIVRIERERETGHSSSHPRRRLPLPLFPSSVVGSLPRPAFLKDIVLPTAGSLPLPGAVAPEAVQAALLESAITSAVAMQLTAGCDVVTDGELGRRSYIGIIAEMAHGFELGTFDDGRPATFVTSPLTPRCEGVIAAEAARLQRVLAKLGAPEHAIKVTLPAPALLGERMWEPTRSAGAYPTREAFVEATVPFLRKELLLLKAAGVHIVQIDDPHLCLFVDDSVRGGHADPEAAAAFAVAKTNEMIEGLQSDDFQLAVHLCRRSGGARRGEHDFGGSLSTIVPHINDLNVSHLTIECTTGGGAPTDAAGEAAVRAGLRAMGAELATLRQDFEIGLGCVSVTPGVVDSVETIVQRVEAVVDALGDPSRITLNPDCGFAPGMGAVVDLDEVYQKLKHQSEAAAFLRRKYAEGLN